MQPGADATLEDRLVYIEDRLAIYNLLATHPPTADSGSEALIRATYAEDTIFDRGANLHGASGLEGIVEFATSAAHRIAIEGGLAHFGNLPLVEVMGEDATATSYIMIVTPDRSGEMRELSNHGSSTGFRIHRVVANRWTLVKRDGRWKIKARKVYPLDGGQPARDLLTRVVSAYEATAAPAAA